MLIVNYSEGELTRLNKIATIEVVNGELTYVDMSKEQAYKMFEAFDFYIEENSGMCAQTDDCDGGSDYGKKFIITTDYYVLGHYHCNTCGTIILSSPLTEYISAEEQKRNIWRYDVKKYVHEYYYATQDEVSRRSSIKEGIALFENREVPVESLSEFKQSIIGELSGAIKETMLTLAADKIIEELRTDYQSSPVLITGNDVYLFDLDSNSFDNFVDDWIENYIEDSWLA